MTHYDSQDEHRHPNPVNSRLDDFIPDIAPMEEMPGTVAGPSGDGARRTQATPVAKPRRESKMGDGQQPPLVVGGQATIDTAVIVCVCAVLGLVVSLAAASPAFAGWAIGTLIAAGGFVLYRVGRVRGKRGAA